MTACYFFLKPIICSLTSLLAIVPTRLKFGTNSAKQISEYSWKISDYLLKKLNYRSPKKRLTKLSFFLHDFCFQHLKKEQLKLVHVGI